MAQPLLHVPPPQATVVEDRGDRITRNPHPLRPRPLQEEEDATASETDGGWLLVDVKKAMTDEVLVEIISTDATVREAVEDSEGDEQSPLFVHAKQYQRILKRRAARQRLEEVLRSRPDKVPFLHVSMHGQLRRSPRGPSGRFLTAEEVGKIEQNKRAQEGAEKVNDTKGQDSSAIPGQDRDEQDGEGDTIMKHLMDNEELDDGSQMHLLGNAKQYQRILKRRAARQRLEELLHSRPPLANYPFRHSPAQLRPRSLSGRFLTDEEMEQKRVQDSVDGLTAAISEAAL